jgi:peptide/nickel transport system permease protein
MAKTIGCLLLILGILITGLLLSKQSITPDYRLKNKAPALKYLFGTDYLGRNIFFRTIKGLSESITIGIFASLLSSVMSVCVGLLAAYGNRTADRICLWIMDCFMGFPSMVLLMLISYAVGGGIKGVVLGVAVTHWPDLARVIRAEVLSVRNSPYVQVSRRMGKSSFHIALHHIFPYVFPQFLTGLILMFPHAIMHEAGITFLGFGLPLDSPAIGAILSESMQQFATGQWWVVIFPGMSLLTVVLLFNGIGTGIRKLISF